MIINWVNFTPWTSLLGGLLIGLSAALLIIFNGRIAGISGILGGLINPKLGDILWRIAFIGGLILAPVVYGFFKPMPIVQINANLGLIVFAGLLVGFGTRYGSGCTSGHGVCGIARLSKRSLIATGCFMCSGLITVFLTHHI